MDLFVSTKILRNEHRHWEAQLDDLQNLPYFAILILTKTYEEINAKIHTLANELALLENYRHIQEWVKSKEKWNLFQHSPKGRSEGIICDIFKSNRANKRFTWIPLPIKWTLAVDWKRVFSSQCHCSDPSNSPAVTRNKFKNRKAKTWSK